MRDIMNSIQSLKKHWAATKDRLAGTLLSFRHSSILEQFASGAASAQNAVDIFKGEWISAFPPEFGVSAGKVPLFRDERLALLDANTSFVGKHVLELGPMEGAHTYQFLKSGAESVLGIESNQRSFLKCLIAKEVMGLAKAKFLCADFLEWLEKNPNLHYQLCVASGVLYHMRDPLRMIGLCARCSDELFLWTHYYDSKIIESVPDLGHRFVKKVECEWDGFRTTGFRREYGAQIWNPLHLGSDGVYSVWLTREAIVKALEHVGFNEIHIGKEDLNHKAGPALTLFARRR
jgi:hypothetical protein